MAASSEAPSCGREQALWIGEVGPPVKLNRPADEEFPPELSGYDRILQTPSHRPGAGILTFFTIAGLILLIAFCFFYGISTPIPSVLTSSSPSAPKH